VKIHVHCHASEDVIVKLVHAPLAQLHTGVYTVRILVARHANAGCAIKTTDYTIVVLTAIGGLYALRSVERTARFNVIGTMVIAHYVIPVDGVKNVKNSAPKHVMGHVTRRQGHVPHVILERG
jgi:hypothetical protein